MKEISKKLRYILGVHFDLRLYLEKKGAVMVARLSGKLTEK